MLKNVSFDEARELMLKKTNAVGDETVGLSESPGRVLAENIYAEIDIPPFDRSPFDGYAIRSADTALADKDAPVTLRILEEIPAGSCPSADVTAGTATKILTGAPIPPGADAVVKFEDTEFTKNSIKLSKPIGTGNIVRAGEDVTAGMLLAKKGDIIDPALLGTMASQGILSIKAFKKPVAGIISTGSELVEAHESISGGKIRNSNRHVLEGACLAAGIDAKNIGTASDDLEAISQLLLTAVDACDIVFVTGGVSVGDYDVTPEAMELAGIEILVRKIALKPGGACCYGIKNGTPVFCLSGNPASSITNFYAVALPCLRKLRGLETHVKKTVIKTTQPFKKPSPNTRLLRGRLDISSGEVLLHFSEQGNVKIHSMVGCDAMAVIPAGSPPLEAGVRLEAFLLD